jgi:NitT/TauT family transport system substrate-binding protein
MSRFKLTRRAALTGASALIAAPAALRAQAADVTFRLNWLLYGFHTPFYLGVERGYYREAGINLTIGEGQGSARTVQAVAAGSETFGLSDGASIINGVSRGAPLQAVMGIMNKSPFAVIVRADRNIRRFQDLAGRTIAATAGEAGLTMFPALLRANNMPADAIRFLRVDGAGKLVSVLEGRADGLLGGIENQALILPQRGVQVVNFAYSELGANTMGLAIHAQRQTVERNADMVRRFMRATQRAFADAERTPEAAIEAGVKIKPDLDRALSLAQLRAGLALVRAADGANQPMGWMSPADWEQTLRIMKEFQDLQTDLAATAFYTNQLVAATS